MSSAITFGFVRKCLLNAHDLLSAFVSGNGCQDDCGVEVDLEGQVVIHECVPNIVHRQREVVGIHGLWSPVRPANAITFIARLVSQVGEDLSVG